MVGVPFLAACIFVNSGVSGPLRIFFPSLYLYKIWVIMGVQKKANKKDTDANEKTLVRIWATIIRQKQNS